VIPPGPARKTHDVKILGVKSLEPRRHAWPSVDQLEGAGFRWSRPAPPRCGVDAYAWHPARYLVAMTDPWAWDWSAVGAVATAAGVLIALGAAFITTRDLIGVRRRDAQDRRREQALRVSAWATSETEFPDIPRANIVGNPWFAAVHVLNGSAASIRDVRVEVGYRGFEGEWKALGEGHEWMIVPPAEPVRAEFVQGHVRNFSEPHNVLLCTLSFRDSNNVRWQRDAFNVLTEADDH
jgi:hypothetical protein